MLFDFIRIRIQFWCTCFPIAMRITLMNIHIQPFYARRIHILRENKRNQVICEWNIKRKWRFNQTMNNWTVIVYRLTGYELIKNGVEGSFFFFTKSELFDRSSIEAVYSCHKQWKTSNLKSLIFYLDRPKINQHRYIPLNNVNSSDDWPNLKFFRLFLNLICLYSNIKGYRMSLFPKWPFVVCAFKATIKL